MDRAHLKLFELLLRGDIKTFVGFPVQSMFILLEKAHHQDWLASLELAVPILG